MGQRNCAITKRLLKLVFLFLLIWHHDIAIELHPEIHQTLPRLALRGAGEFLYPIQLLNLVKKKPISKWEATPPNCPHTKGCAGKQYELRTND